MKVVIDSSLLCGLWALPMDKSVLATGCDLLVVVGSLWLMFRSEASGDVQ